MDAVIRCETNKFLCSVSSSTSKEDDDEEEVEEDQKSGYYHDDSYLASIQLQSKIATAIIRWIIDRWEESAAKCGVEEKETSNQLSIDELDDSINDNNREIILSCGKLLPIAIFPFFFARSLARFIYTNSPNCKHRCSFPQNRTSSSLSLLLAIDNNAYGN